MPVFGNTEIKKSGSIPRFHTKQDALRKGKLCSVFFDLIAHAETGVLAHGDRFIVKGISEAGQRDT